MPKLILSQMLRTNDRHTSSKCVCTVADLRECNTLLHSFAWCRGSPCPTATLLPSRAQGGLPSSTDPVWTRCKALHRRWRNLYLADNDYLYNSGGREALDDAASARDGDAIVIHHGDRQYRYLHNMQLF